MSPFGTCGQPLEGLGGGVGGGGLGGGEGGLLSGQYFLHIFHNIGSHDL